jgi:hypothetical protein
MKRLTTRFRNTTSTRWYSLPNLYDTQSPEFRCRTSKAHQELDSLLLQRLRSSSTMVYGLYAGERKDWRGSSTPAATLSWQSSSVLCWSQVPQGSSSDLRITPFRSQAPNDPTIGRLFRGQ